MTWPKHAAEYFQREQEFYDAQAVVERCLLCDWQWIGSAAAGRLEAAEHRREAHPERARPKKRQVRHLGTFRQAQLDAEEKEELDLARRKRALLHGIAVEDW